MTSLDHYLNFATVNESPRPYHVWSGLSLLSALIGRRVWTDMELYTVYPHMYVILAGPPGVAKSTAMDVAKDIVKDKFKHIAIAPAAITKEAVVQMMAKEDSHCIRSYDLAGKKHKFSQLSVFADEIVSLLTCGGNPTGMIDFMTELFGGKDYRETTKNKGDNEIKNPFLSVLACCTIDTLKQLVQAKVVSGGMSRRCVFVVETKNDRPVAWIRFTEDQLESKRVFLRRAELIQTVAGKFAWTRDAEDLYVAWYNDNFHKAETCQSPVTQHFLRTKPAYCIKISMLLAVSGETPTLVHSSDTFQRAIDIVTSVEDGAAKLFDTSGRNELAAITGDVEAFIQDRKKVKKSELYSRFWRELKDGNTQELDKILSHLARLGKVKEETVKEDRSAITYVSAVG